MPAQTKMFETTKPKSSNNPTRFRFEKFSKTTHGVVNPEKTKKKKPHKLNEPEFRMFNPGEAGFMEVMGKSVQPSTVQRNVAYTKQDKQELPDYLTHPYVYIQKLLQHGGYKPMVHPDIFVDFKYVKNSHRDNKNMAGDEMIQALKQMSKEERYQFYSRYIEMNDQLYECFRKFTKAMKDRGIIKLPEVVQHVKPKLPKQQLTELAQGQLTPNGEISLVGFMTFLRNLGYPSEDIQQDAHQLFNNVLIGDDPVKIASRKIDSLISFNAFLYNVSKYLKIKYKLRGIFTHNSAKQRNLRIKESLEPYLGLNWRIFKMRLRAQKEKEQPNTYPEREALIKLKRIYAKHLQNNNLRFIMMDVPQIVQEYTNDINKERVRLETMNEFFKGLFDHLRYESFSVEDAVNYIVIKKVPQVYVDQQIKFIRKILKHYGYLEERQQSIYASIPYPKPQTTITRKQIDDFIQFYTAKKHNELSEFKELVMRLKDFETNCINTVKLNHYECWRWNMVGEWLVRKLVGLDKQILELLGWKRYKDFLAPPKEDEEDQEQEITEVEDDTEAGIDEALAQFQTAAQDLINTTHQPIKPIEEKKETINQLMDSFDAKSPTTQKPNTQDDEEDELDRKIRNAIILQGKCLETISSIHDQFHF